MECANQAVIVMASHMLKAYKLEKLFWAEVVAHVVYTPNRCPTRALRFVLRTPSSENQNLPFGYWEGMRESWLMCLETKIIIKKIAFMENNGSIRNNLEMCLSGRSEGPMMVVVDE